MIALLLRRSNVFPIFADCIELPVQDSGANLPGAGSFSGTISLVDWESQSWQVTWFGGFPLLLCGWTLDVRTWIRRRRIGFSTLRSGVERAPGGAGLHLSFISPFTIPVTLEPSRKPGSLRN